jgi:hypothetical protein
MKDLSKLNKLSSPGKESKTLKTLKNLKQWNVWDLKYRNLWKLDKEFDNIRKNAERYRDNNLNKEDLDKEMNLSEKLVSWIIHDNYMQKFNEKSNAMIYINRFVSNDNKKYDLAIWEEGKDARFEQFETVDDVLKRMKDLVS